MPAGLIKQTHEDMLNLASQGQSTVEDYMAHTRAMVAQAEELAMGHMTGAAGTAVLQKAQEMQQNSDRLAHTATEKYQGIGNFAQAGMNAAHEAASRISSIAGA